MGYYADYDGYIKFKNVPSDEDLDKLRYAFGECYRSEETMFAVYGHEKYYEETIIDYLDRINELTEYGEIEYYGEDNCHWRFVFTDGEWIEEQGFVYYESELNKAKDDKEEFLGRIIDVMQDCLDNPKGETIEGTWYDNVKKELESIMYAWKVFT